MKQDAKIYVAGHAGLVGSALVRRLQALGYTNVLVRTRPELDLTNRTEVERFFAWEHPEYVFMAAARVGGILANCTYPAEFLVENLLIQTHVIDQAYRAAVRRLLFLGSSCIYPKFAPQPIKEEYLLAGPLEPTNRPYAIAKICGIEMCWSYNRQYGTRFVSAMPTNLFGPGDRYHRDDSHLVPALMRRMHEAKVGREHEVVVWGTGAPRRELLYADDAADAFVFLMNLPEREFELLVWNEDHAPIINVGSGTDTSVSELAELIADVVGYEGRLVYDRSKPDGTPRKLLDVSRLSSLGWRSRTPLRDGLERTYLDYASKLPQPNFAQRIQVR
ncbi:MAG TPA: GDP-L-fucose synthase [Candidatus Acidoferrum sp.]|nr:GDP-L-fucose synthase [Candidatus Acidoferrum sp.]